MANILIVGATSAIAQACGREWCRRGHHLFLVGRSEDHLQIIADDLVARGGHVVGQFAQDLNDHLQHQLMVEYAMRELTQLDVILIAHGTGPRQFEAQSNYEKTLEVIQANALSVISILTEIVNQMERVQMHGTIVVLSSTSSDRGRPSSYIFGAAKAMVNLFCQGLRSRFNGKGIQILTIKLGPVVAPAPGGSRQGLFLATPDRVARGISRAVRAHLSVAYVPGFWSVISLFSWIVPDSFLRRLKI